MINDTLVLTAVKGSAPATRLRPLIATREAAYNTSAELCLGVLVAYAAARSTWLACWALPLVILLQRSLRHGQLLSQARIDAKTGLLNAATWQREAGLQPTWAARQRTPAAVAIIDIDHFKAINDTYGHLTGDAVLAALADTAQALLRDQDLIGRFGGKEFTIYLPRTDADQAARIAERLRAAIPHLAIPAGPPGSPVPTGITASIGVVATSRATGSLLDYLATADRALYQAKAGGRNRVCLISDDTPTSEPATITGQP